jgi:glycerol-3-phosphate dehydrogenase
MVGPNAEEISDKDDVGTTEDVLENIVKTARMSVPDFDMKQAITSFAGNRPISSKKDWIIEESRVAGFINLIGIDSPGLTASPAIALKVAGLLKQAGLELRNKKDFMAYRKPIIQVKDKNFKGDINSTNPDEHIICRCEQVTETEIIDALHRNIAIKSIDAIKRRTRAGMGKCQSGFCRSRVKEIIARELHIPVEEVTQRGKDSPGLPERAKRGKYIKL